MRRHRTVPTLAAAGALALTLAACSQPAERKSTDGDGTLSQLSIATGTTAGVYFPLGGAMAEIVNKHVTGVTATAEATGASVENVNNLKSGVSQVAIVQANVAYQAVHGEGKFEGGPVDDLRVLMVAYPNVYHTVTLGSINKEKNFECFSDVQGSRFSVGAPGSGNEVSTKQVFGALGLPFDDSKVLRYSYSETATALREGQLDAGSWVVGEGHGSLKELEATNPIHLVPLCDDEVAKVTEKYPYYSPHTIKGNVYSTVKEDVNTVALWNLVLVKKDFPEDLAYTMVKALYDNSDMLSAVYKPGQPHFVPATYTNAPIPVHPGAAKLASEAGVDLPAEARP